MKMTLNQMLVELDGFKPSEGTRHALCFLRKGLLNVLSSICSVSSKRSFVCFFLCMSGGVMLQLATRL